MLRAYLAAPFLDAPLVRRFGAQLVALGIDVTSTWADQANGPEALDAMPVDEVRRVAHANDRDLLSAHVVVALARDGAGAEMFAEVRLALAHRIPVLWIGSRRPLSAYREGAHRATSIEEGLTLLSGFADIVGALAPFEKRRVRETIWDIIEALAAVAHSRPRPRSVA